MDYLLIFSHVLMEEIFILDNLFYFFGIFLAFFILKLWLF